MRLACCQGHVGIENGPGGKAFIATEQSRIYRKNVGILEERSKNRVLRKANKSMLSKAKFKELVLECQVKTRGCLQCPVIWC